MTRQIFSSIPLYRRKDKIGRHKEPLLFIFSQVPLESKFWMIAEHIAPVQVLQICILWPSSTKTAYFDPSDAEVTVGLTRASYPDRLPTRPSYKANTHLHMQVSSAQQGQHPPRPQGRTDSDNHLLVPTPTLSQRQDS